MRTGEQIFVDSGAWIALAVTEDPLHKKSRDAWERILSSGGKIRTSIPVVMETFTFLDRNTIREVALSWKDSLATIPRFDMLECTAKDLDRAWSWLKRGRLHGLSAVDATSFALMTREKIRLAFAFDHHFASAGFRIVD